MAKLSKTSGSDADNKKKNKKKKSGPNAVAMKVKPQKSNLFESIWSRRKFDILGKKRKGEERRIGLARSQAVEKRKKTLLKEYERSGKASVFVDKRIGEQNETIGEFDKAILRSQRARQLKVNKKSKYNLSDGEEDDFGIHGLGEFSEKDDFEDELLPEEDNVDGAEESSLHKQLDAHGSHDRQDRAEMEGEENKHKSKKEVMDEIIAKSKFFKAQRAKNREENEHVIEDLDKKFASLTQSQALLSLTDPRKMNALKALVNKSIPHDHMTKGDSLDAKNTDTLLEDKPDTYDKLVKEMALEMRARPSDRTKTPEEIAQEERERLEQLEEERQKRMLSTDGFSDEENEDAGNISTQKLRSVSGDDLGDSFSLDEGPRNKKGWVDEVLERRDGSDSEGEDGDSSEDSESEEDDEEESDDEDNGGREVNVSLKDWEQSDDDIVDKVLEDEEEEEEEESESEEHDNDEKHIEPREIKLSKNNDVSKTSKEIKVCEDVKKFEANAKRATKELPYIIEAPKSLEEFSSLLDKCSNTDTILLIINRIRASNAIKLAAENRKKMQVFYGVLLQYFAVIANDKPLNIELLNSLAKPLMEMSVEIPYFAAICARQRILRTRTQFCDIVKNPENSSWPSSKTLFLLRLWSMIFPCSDFRHVVMTPAILLMCEYLLRCPIVSGRDIAIGSFLCSMLLSVAMQSQKLCPEAIMFLRTLLVASIDRKQISYEDSQFYHLVELKSLGSLLRIQNSINKISPLNFLEIIEMPEDSSFFRSDNFRVSLLGTVVETLRGYITIYEGLSSFPEIFLPISSLLLEAAEQEKTPDALKDNFKEVAQLIKRKVDEQHMLRQPLQMRKQKPVPIKLLNPKFEENFVKGRDYDPDRERVERRKLQKQIKREAKGAARELRKDNHFLFEVKEKEKILQEEEKTEKYGKALAFLQEQEHAFKSGQLGKGRKRRR